jgi:hypothetical protein
MDRLVENLIVYTNNLVSLDGTLVGRIDRASYLTSQGTRGKTTFKTASVDRMTSGYDTPHEIGAPLYVGGPDEWKINPEFEAEVRKIINA